MRVYRCVCVREGERGKDRETEAARGFAESAHY